MAGGFEIVLRSAVIRLRQKSYGATGRPPLRLGRLVLICVEFAVNSAKLLQIFVDELAESRILMLPQKRTGPCAELVFFRVQFEEPTLCSSTIVWVGLCLVPERQDL